MVTLIKKSDNRIKIILPEINIGERFFMIDPKYIEHWYGRGGLIYLDKRDWDIKEY